MSQLSQRARDRRRTAMRRASGIDILEIGVGGQVLTQLLAGGAVPSEIFEPSVQDIAPPVSAPVIVLGERAVMRVRRRAGGFPGGLDVMLWFLPHMAPAVMLDAGAGFLGSRARTTVMQRAQIWFARKSRWLAPGEEDVVEVAATHPMRLTRIETRPERFTLASGRRFAQARRRGRAGEEARKLAREWRRKYNRGG